MKRYIAPSDIDAICSGCSDGTIRKTRDGKILPYCKRYGCYSFKIAWKCSEG